MGLDLRTVWLVGGVLSMSSGLLVMVLRRHYSEHMGRAMNLWGAGCLSVGAAFVLSAKSDRMAASVVPPLLGAAALAMQYLAVVELKRQKRLWAWVWGPLLLTGAGYLWFGWVAPNQTIALIVFNVLRMVMVVRIGTSFLRLENGRRPFVDVVAGCMYGLLAVSTMTVILNFLQTSHFTVQYNFNSPRTVYNVSAIAVSQSVLFSLFLLAITERLNLQFKQQAMHDPLTDLFNRRALEDIAFHQKALSLRMGQSFSVFMVDVDHFKRINDAYGHAVGDFILRSVALALRRGLRAEDYLGRWGGDEFCVLLPGTTREQAEMVAERVMTIFETLEIEVQETPIPLSISLGAASVDQSVGGFDVLLGMADQALYRAKEKGRRGYEFAEIQKADRVGELAGPKAAAAEFRG